MFEGNLSTPTGRSRAWIDSLFVDHAILRQTWTNFRTVIPGRVYRCNHPTPWRLRLATRRYRLKTLVNLRGHRKCGSDALSREAAHAIGLTHIDMAFESRNAPHRDRIERFERIYRDIRFPMLMHCKSGADRTGLAAGLVILFEGGTAQQALRQLSWKNGHFNSSRTGVLDAFFLRYQAEAEGRITFMDWVRTEYDEDRLRADFRAGRIAAFMNDKILRRE